MDFLHRDVRTMSHQDLTECARAVGIRLAFDVEATQLGQPEVGQWCLGLAVDVLAQLQRSASAAGDDQWQIAVLMRGPIAHARSEGEDGVVDTTFVEDLR